MSKPTVAVCVICRNERDGWVNPALVSALLRLQQDPRFDWYIEMTSLPWRVEYARNKCMAYARDMGFDTLVQIDNDMIPPPNFADIMQDAILTGKAVVTIAYGVPMAPQADRIMPDDHGPLEGDFRVTGGGCGGMMIISSEVWQTIPVGPWFRWLVNDDELQSRKIHEDNFFCEYVQEKGLDVWTHEYALAGHLKTTNVTKTIFEKVERERVPGVHHNRPARSKPPVIGV